MDNKHVRNLIEKFEKSLIENERMVNSLSDLGGTLSNLDKSISIVDKSFIDFYKLNDVENITEKSMETISSLQLVKKQSISILKFIEEFKNVQQELSNVQENINYEYEKLVSLNSEKLSLKKELEEFKNYIDELKLDVSYDFKKVHNSNNKIKKDIANLGDAIDTKYDSFKEDILSSIKELFESKSEEIQEVAATIEDEYDIEQLSKDGNVDKLLELANEGNKIGQIKFDAVNYARECLWNRRCLATKKAFITCDTNLERSNDDANLTADKAGCSVEYTLLSHSDMSSKLTLKDGCKSVSFGSYNSTVGKDGVSDYTTDLIVGEVSDNILQKVKSFGFYLTENDNVYIINKDPNGNIILNKNGLEDVSDETAKRIMASSTHYVWFIWSNGQIKNNASYYINADKYDLDTRFKMLNDMTGGALKDHAEKAFKKKGYLDEKDMEKLVSRFPLFATGAIEFGELATERFGILYINSKFKGVADKLKADKNTPESVLKVIDAVSKQILDGEALMSNRFASEASLHSLNALVNPKDLLGFDFQNRTKGVNTKAFTVVDDHEMIQDLAKFLMKTFEGCFTIFGNLDCIGLICDNNAAKLVATEVKNAKNYLLEVAVASTANSSAQLFDIVEYMASVTGEIERLNTFISNKVYDYARSSMNFMVDEVLNKSTSCSNMLMAVNKRVALTDIVVMSSYLNSVSKMAVSRSSKNKIKLDGLSLRIVFENTFLYGEGMVDNILKATDKYVMTFNKKVLRDKKEEIDVIYNTWKEECVGATEEEKVIAKRKRTKSLDDILCAFMIKYPAISKYEGEVVRCMTMFEIKELFMEEANRLGLEFSDRRILNSYKFFLYRGEGTLILAPINLIKDKHAGMDTDFDDVSIYFEKDIVDIAIEYKTMNNNQGGEMTLIVSDDVVENFEIDTFIEDFLTNQIEEKVEDMKSIF